jgi:hypothetical protein
MLELSKSVVPDQKAVTKLTEMDPRTVDRHWEAAVALNAANAIAAVVLDHPVAVSEPKITVDAAPAAAPAFCSDVWGVPATSSREDQPTGTTGHAEPVVPAASGETLTLETIVPATILTLVDRLRPGHRPSGSRSTGRNLVQFLHPGAMVFRSTLGIRAQARRRLRAVRTGIPDSDAWLPGTFREAS